MKDEFKHTENVEPFKNDQDAAESNLLLPDKNEADDYVEWEHAEDKEPEYVTRAEFEAVFSDICQKQFLQQMQYMELQKRVEETPQRLVCKTKSRSAKKICVADYNIGLSPTYIIDFQYGHKSRKIATLCIYVHRPGGTEELQYEGDIIGLPTFLEQETKVLIRSRQNEIGQISFVYESIVEDAISYFQRIVQEQKKLIIRLEKRINELALMLDQHENSRLNPQLTYRDILEMK